MSKLLHLDERSEPRLTDGSPGHAFSGALLRTLRNCVTIWLQGLASAAAGLEGKGSGRARAIVVSRRYVRSRILTGGVADSTYHRMCHLLVHSTKSWEIIAPAEAENPATSFGRQRVRGENVPDQGYVCGRSSGPRSDRIKARGVSSCGGAAALEALGSFPLSHGTVTDRFVRPKRPLKALEREYAAGGSG